MVDWDAACRRKSDLITAVTIVPTHSMHAIVMFAPVSPIISNSSAYILVNRMPKIWAAAFSKPADVPSGSGYVNSAANSKPTGK